MFVVKNEKCYIHADEEDKTVKQPPSGIYEIQMDMAENVIMYKKDFSGDQVIELPNPAYQNILQKINSFDSPEMSERFKSLGVNKQAALLVHGEPGTGKDALFKLITEKVVERGGYVFQDVSPGHLKRVASMMESTEELRNALKVYTLPEVDRYTEPDSGSESNLLTFLDSPVKHSNTLVLANTNYLDRIPLRVRRPGRFSWVIEMKHPNAEERREFVRQMSPEIKNLEMIVEATSGLSVAQLREVLIAHSCFGESVSEVVKRIS